MTKSNDHRQWYTKNKKKRIKQMKTWQSKNAKRFKRVELKYRISHRKEDAERSRFWRFKKKYGLSKEDYLNILKQQNYKCALCYENLSKVKGKNGVDHCHKSGKIRGIIHSHCNLILGFSKENVKILKKAIQYINKHK